jgi:hypothetical protein
MAPARIRLSEPTLKVLKYLVENARTLRSGADIAKATNVGSGTLYPLLELAYRRVGKRRPIESWTSKEALVQTHR